MTAAPASSSTVGLNWVDNSGDESTFNIERSLDGSSFTSLESVGANVVSYTDVGLSPDSTYWYRVNAENAAGTSTWSNVAWATTPARHRGDRG